MAKRGGLRCADPELDTPVGEEAFDDHGHLVELYETDRYLAESVRDFMVPGLFAGESIIVVATREHRELIDEALDSTDVDLQEARNEGRYVLLDAAETLSRFMVDGEPEPALFSAAVGAIVARAADVGSDVRIFGEMVALLWDDGNVGAALKLEEMWNELALVHPFKLLCAYPLGAFHNVDELRDVCRLHTAVVPAESYMEAANADARMRWIAEMQQRIATVETEGRKRALELNAEVVQGLAAARMALELGEPEILTSSIDDALARATRMVSELLGQRKPDLIGPGDLR